MPIATNGNTATLTAPIDDADRLEVALYVLDGVGDPKIKRALRTACKAIQREADRLNNSAVIIEVE